MTAAKPVLATLCAMAALSAAFVSPAQAAGSKTPQPEVEQGDNGEPVIVHEGEASFYGPGFHGKKTANGEVFNQNKPTAASKVLPLGARATVTNEDNGKSVDVVVNDRGPHVRGRVIDLSKGAARKLDMIEEGTAPVRVEVKPSDQPTEAMREKVEHKAEEIDGNAVAARD